MSALLRGVRVLLPEWTVALVRPTNQLPANVAVFRVDPKSVRCVCGRLKRNPSKIAFNSRHTPYQLLI